VAKNLLTLAADGEENTAHVAAALARCCKKGDCILLVGELGAGKTVFARGFVRALCGEAEEVLSPTFTLMQNYTTPAGWAVWHFDLYRLKQALELEQLGLDDALMNGITLIEWPEIATDRLPQAALTVQLKVEGESKRRITFSGDASAWQSRLEGIV